MECLVVSDFALEFSLTERLKVSICWQKIWQTVLYSCMSLCVYETMKEKIGQTATNSEDNSKGWL